MAPPRAPLSPVTAHSYARKVALALEATGAEGLAQMVAAPAASFALLRARYPTDSTLKQVLTAVLSAARAKGLRGLAEWRRLHAQVARAAAAARTGELTPALRRRYVCWDDIVAAARAAERSAGAHATLRSSMAALLLCMVTRLLPKRSDFGDLAVVPPGAKHRGNRVLLPARGDATLVLTEFKTARAHGALQQPCGAEVTALLRRSLAAWPRAHAFVSARSGAPLSASSYGRLVRDTTQAALGKPVGVTMLRHIFVSDVAVYEAAPARAELARLMMHSPAEQARYNITRRDGRPVCPRPAPPA